MSVAKYTCGVQWHLTNSEKKDLKGWPFSQNMQLLSTYEKRWFIIHQMVAPINDFAFHQIILVFVIYRS